MGDVYILLADFYVDVNGGEYTDMYAGAYLGYSIGDERKALDKAKELFEKACDLNYSYRSNDSSFYVKKIMSCNVQRN